MGLSVWLFDKLLGISQTGCPKFVKKLLKKSWKLLSFSKKKKVVDCVFHE